MTPCWCPWAMLPPQLYWPWPTATSAMAISGPQLMLRALSGSMALLQLEFLLISMIHVTTRGRGNHMCWSLAAVLSMHSPSLALGKLALPLYGHYSRRASPTPHHRHGRPGSNVRFHGRVGLAPYLAWWGRSQHPRLTKSSTTKTHIQGFKLAHPNIYPIFDLLECLKGLVRLSHNSGSPWLRATAGYLRGVSVRV